MEKYIIILVILATIYFIQNNLKTTEGFEATATQSVYGVDDLNAINTLAQISRQLMSAGGLTVPGNMTVSGAFNVICGSKDIIFKADLSPNSYDARYGNVKFMHSNDTQGIGIGYSGIYKTGTNTNTPDINIQPQANGQVLIMGNLTSQGNITAVNNIIANNALDVNAGGGNVLKVDAGGVHCKRNMNIDGSLLINPAGLYGGTINCNTLFTSSGSLSIYKDNNWQKSNINCGNITTDGLNVNGIINSSRLNVAGQLSSNGIMINVIYPAPWNHAWWTEKMATFFSRGEPDGIKKEFLIIHPHDNNVNHALRNTVYMIGIKQGNQVYFFEPHHRHENIPNPASNNSTDNHWRRVIP